MMKTRRTFLSVLCLLTALLFLFTAASCAMRGQDTSAPSGDEENNFSGNNSDYVDNIGYEEEPSAGADLAAAYEQTYRSVVTVSVNNAGGQVQTGTGFIVDSSQGLVVTSSSLFTNSFDVVAARSCTVELYDGTDIPANLQGYDAIGAGVLSASANSDIAIVQLDNIINGVYTSSGLEVTVPSAVVFSDSDAIVYGEECYTIATLAHEEDVLPGLMNEGIITKPFNTHTSAFYFYDSQRQRETAFFDGSFEYLIQTGVPVNGGNAGAPLFNAEGKVIGMINMRVNDTYVYSENGPFGIAFATPSETLYRVLRDAGISIEYEQQAAERESCIVNADDLIDNKANDAVAQMLMSESSDYLVIDGNTDVVFRAEGAESAEGGAAQRVAENRLDRTVKIIAYSRTETGQILSEGSGFLIDKKGYVMTNLHVVNALSERNQESSGLANTSVEPADNVYCLFERGTTSGGEFVVMPMDIIAYHQQGDLAVLKFRNPIYHETAENSEGRAEYFESACLLESFVPRQGENVVALGNALGYGVSVSAGIVSIPEFTSYYNLYGYNMIQTDCPINSGNSGGALFDADGNVIGINTLGYGGEGYDNVSWAIPASFAVNFVESVNQGVSAGNVHITAAGAGANIVLES